MECQNCELKQRQFYCDNCLKQHLLSYRLQLSHAANERKTEVASAENSLKTVVEPARLRRAALKAAEERVRDIWEGLEAVRKANEAVRERLQTKRDNLSTRRRMLAMALSPDLFPSSSSSSSSSSSPAPHASHSPPNARPVIGQRRLSGTPPSQTTPSGSRPGSSARQLHPFPTATQIARSVSASAQVNRAAPTAASPPNVQAPFPRRLYGHNSETDKDLTKQIDEAQFQLTALSDTIARARSGLVQELVEVFSVVEVGGRPPLGGKAGTKGEWTIGGLVLPVPGDMRRYPPDHINAVLTHTLHFLSLLAFYLGVKLPFDVVWSRSSTPPTSSSASGGPVVSSKTTGLLGVGTPWIGAIRGGENGGWTRWSTKHPLHVSANPPPPSSAQTSPPLSPGRPASHVRSASTPISRTKSAQAPPPSLDESQIEEPASTTASGSSFTTALAMLLYDACYLAYTQGIDVPLAQAGEVLGNLWAVCCSPELGRKSHATFPLLPAPTPASFPLDFAQLLQATAANPTRARARGTPGRELRHERIVEEDDGWDLVDDIST